MYERAHGRDGVPPPLFHPSFLIGIIFPTRAFIVAASRAHHARRHHILGALRAAFRSIFFVFIFVLAMRLVRRGRALFCRRSFLRVPRSRTAKPCLFFMILCAI